MPPGILFVYFWKRLGFFTPADTDPLHMNDAILLLKDEILENEFARWFLFLKQDT